MFFGMVLNGFTERNREVNLLVFVAALHDLEGLWQFRELVWNGEAGGERLVRANRRCKTCRETDVGSSKLRDFGILFRQGT